jgi:hypothetical protein
MNVKQTIAQMTEAERARHFESHAGDMSRWSDQPVRAASAPDSRTEFVIAVDDDAVDQLQELADLEGIDIIELLERWVAQKAQEGKRSSGVPSTPRPR